MTADDLMRFCGFMAIVACLFGHGITFEEFK